MWKLLINLFVMTFLMFLCFCRPDGEQTNDFNENSNSTEAVGYEMRNWVICKVPKCMAGTGMRGEEERSWGFLVISWFRREIIEEITSFHHRS